MQDSFIYQGGPRFSWDNGQKGSAQRLARPDWFYTSKDHGLDFKLKDYYIHGYSVGSDHSPVQIEINIGKERIKRTTFKWNTSHLSEDFIYELRTRWDRLSDDASFFFKLKHITRFFRQHSKQRAKKTKRKS